MANVKVPTRGDRDSYRGSTPARAIAVSLGCVLILLAACAGRAHAATRLLGEYRGEYGFHFSQSETQPGPTYSDEAEELFMWDVRFASPAVSPPAGSAAIDAYGIDRFTRTGDLERPGSVSCTVAPRSPELKPGYFVLEDGATAGTVDVRAIVPMFTGSAGQVAVSPTSNEVCAGLEATGAAINCDPFGCGWECVGFAANPAFDEAWVISLLDVPLRSFPRSFQASGTGSACSGLSGSYAATRSLKATLSVIAQAPPPGARVKHTRKTDGGRAHGRALHSAGR